MVPQSPRLVNRAPCQLLSNSKVYPVSVEIRQISAKYPAGIVVGLTTLLVGIDLENGIKHQSCYNHYIPMITDHVLMP